MRKTVYMDGIEQYASGADAARAILRSRGYSNPPDGTIRTAACNINVAARTPGRTAYGHAWSHQPMKVDE